MLLELRRRLRLPAGDADLRRRFRRRHEHGLPCVRGAVAGGGEAFGDEPVELRGERLVDEPLELGPVRLDELGDPSLEVDRTAQSESTTTGRATSGTAQSGARCGSSRVTPASLASSSSRTRVTIRARWSRRAECRWWQWVAELRERLIVFGTLSEPASRDAVGVALALQALDRETAVALLREGGAGLDAFPSIEVHDWEFGGRR